MEVSEKTLEVKEAFSYLMSMAFNFEKMNDNIVGCDVSVRHRKLPFKMDMDIWDQAFIPTQMRDPNTGVHIDGYSLGTITEGEEISFSKLPLTVGSIDDVFGWLEKTLKGMVTISCTLKVIVDRKQNIFGIALVRF